MGIFTQLQHGIQCLKENLYGILSSIIWKDLKTLHHSHKNVKNWQNKIIMSLSIYCNIVSINKTTDLSISAEYKHAIIWNDVILSTMLRVYSFFECEHTLRWNDVILITPLIVF